MILLGDIHGNFNIITTQIRKYNIKNENIIQVGDFGIGFDDRIDLHNLNHLNNILSERNINLYVIRGNHDNPSWFKGELNLTNITLLPDYSILKIEDKNILFIGGAISIDREKRETNKSYWKDEVVVFDKDKLESIKGIDMVVTHTAPIFVYPMGIDAPIIDYFAEDDFTLKKDLLHERKTMDEIYNILNENNTINYWFYGHFHFSNKMFYNTTEFILLNCNEFFELK